MREQLGVAPSRPSDGVDKAYVDGASVSTPTANTSAEWDANLNLSANAFLPGQQTNTPTTGALTTTLTVASAQFQSFTGSGAIGQNVVLPTTGVTAGMSYSVGNKTVEPLVVHSSNGNTVVTLPAGQSATFTAAVNTPITSIQWGVQALLNSVFLTAATSMTLAAGASGLSFTFPAANDTIVGLAATQTMTNKTLTSPVLTTPALGTPASGNLANCTGFPNAGMLVPVQAHTGGTETYTITSGSVTQIAGTTINGSYAPNVGDRILITTAPAASGVGPGTVATIEPANGIYVVTSNTTNLSLSRSADFSSPLVSPSGFSVYSESVIVSWLAQSIWTCTTPSTRATFTWGTSTIGFQTTSGLALLPNDIYLASTVAPIGMNNGTGGTFIDAASNAGNQTLTLPATATSDTLVGRASIDTLTNKKLVAPALVTSAGASLGVIDGEQFCILSAAHTLTSQTAAQPIFNATTNGAVTVPIGTYFFETVFSLTALNTTTSSIFGWALVAGTATITSQYWSATTIGGTSSAVISSSAPSTAICVANTAGNGHAHISGVVRIGAAGTLIPSVSLNTAAAAVVGINAYFRIWSVATTNTVTTVGTWS
jgi:hypothetical protein